MGAPHRDPAGNWSGPSRVIVCGTPDILIGSGQQSNVKMGKQRISAVTVTPPETPGDSEAVSPSPQGMGASGPLCPLRRRHAAHGPRARAAVTGFLGYYFAWAGRRGYAECCRVFAGVAPWRAKPGREGERLPCLRWPPPAGPGKEVDSSTCAVYRHVFCYLASADVESTLGRVR